MAGPGSREPPVPDLGEVAWKTPRSSNRAAAVCPRIAPSEVVLVPAHCRAGAGWPPSRGGCRPRATGGEQGLLVGEGALQLRAHLSLPCPFLHFRKGLASTSTRVRPAAPPNLPPLTPPRNWPARSIPARLAQFCAVNPSSRVNPSGDCGAAPPPRAAILPSDPLARADPPLPRPRRRRGRSPRRSHEPPACSPARQPFPEPLPNHGCHRLRKRWSAADAGWTVRSYVRTLRGPSARLRADGTDFLPSSARPRPLPAPQARPLRASSPLARRAVTRPPTPGEGWACGPRPGAEEGRPPAEAGWRCWGALGRWQQCKGMGEPPTPFAVHPGCDPWPNGVEGAGTPGEGRGGAAGMRARGSITYSESRTHAASRRCLTSGP